MDSVKRKHLPRLTTLHEMCDREYENLSNMLGYDPDVIKSNAGELTRYVANLKASLLKCDNIAHDAICALYKNGSTEEANTLKALKASKRKDVKEMITCAKSYLDQLDFSDCVSNIESEVSSLLSTDDANQTFVANTNAVGNAIYSLSLNDLPPIDNSASILRLSPDPLTYRSQNVMFADGDTDKILSKNTPNFSNNFVNHSIANVSETFTFGSNENVDRVRLTPFHHISSGHNVNHCLGNIPIYTAPQRLSLNRPHVPTSHLNVVTTTNAPFPSILNTSLANTPIVGSQNQHFGLNNASHRPISTFDYSGHHPRYSTLTNPVVVHNAPDPASLFIVKQQLFQKSADPFDGDPSNYRSWLNMIKNKIAGLNLSALDQLTILKANTIKEPYELIKKNVDIGGPDADRTLHNTLIDLESEFGSNFKIANSLTSQVESFIPIKSVYHTDRLKDLLNICQRIDANMPSSGDLTMFSNPYGCRSLWFKLPDSLQNAWTSVCDDYKTVHGGCHILSNFSRRKFAN